MGDIFAYLGAMFFSFIIFTLIIYYVIFWRIKYNVHSHWHVLFDDFSFSPKKFYQLLKEEIHGKNISELNFNHVGLKEGNVLSSRRLYLRVLWKEHHFDVCAAPYGNGFFISWWLVYKHSFLEWCVLLIPFIGLWLHRKFFTVTYYKIDTTLMFMEYVHLCVINVLEELTISEGVRLLDVDERKPILNDIFSR